MSSRFSRYEGYFTGRKGKVYYASENKLIKRNRAIRFWVLFTLAAVLFFSAGSFALWLLAPKPDLRILVVDKTVPHTDYREHRSLFWALNHAKVLNKGGEREWRPGKDYVGFYPEKFVASDASFSSELEQDHLVGIDCLFLADTYGVYVDDYKYAEKGLTHLDSSRKIFGGLEPGEVDVIEAFVRDGGALVAEFNAFYPPTGKAVQERMENLLGLKSSGWTGRYFADLSNRMDVPSWAMRNWKTHYGQDWDFTGPGYIIAHQNTELLVLQEGKDVGSKGLVIEPVRPRAPLTQGVSRNTPYSYWFDIVSPESGTEVLARFRFHLTPQGEEKMRASAVPETFPAVLLGSGASRRVYLAGDFSDSSVSLGPYFFSGWPGVRRILCALGNGSPQSRFYWSFYYPLLSNLFGEEL